MEAKELMIGDWVRMRRWDIDGATFYTSKVICLQKDGFLEYEPIPLTEEILEKNGFQAENGFLSPDYTLVLGDKCVWWSRTLGISITRYPNEGNLYTPYVCIPICKYVHELQHALSLCGLNELADNLELRI